MLGLLGWFAPEIIGRTSLKQHVPKLLFPTFRGTVELGDASLAWMAPIEIRQVVIDDEQGHPLATIGRIRSSKPLWKLASDSMHLGTFELVDTVAFLAVEGQASNWDGTITDFSAPSTAATPQVEVRLPSLCLQVQRDPQAEVLKLTGLNVGVRCGETSPASVDIVAQWRPSEAAGTCGVTATYDPAATTTFRGQLTLETFDLQALAPVCAAVAADARLTGRASGTLAWEQADAAWTAWSLQSDLAVADLVAVGWPALNGDTLQLQAVTAKGALRVLPTAIEFDDFLCKTDVSEIRASGAAPWPTAAGIDLAKWERDVNVDVTCNLAELARRLPKTLHLKDGVSIQAAPFVAGLQGRTDAQGRVWEATVKLDKLAATVDGQPRNWSTPIDGRAIVRAVPTGWQADRVTLNSDFCQVQASGTSIDAHFRVRADLDRLWHDVAPLIEAHGGNLSGVVQLDGEIRQSTRNEVELILDGQADRLGWQAANAAPAQEAQVRFHVDAVGTGPAEAPWESIRTAKLELRSADDFLVASLTAPVKAMTANTEWPLTAELAGDWSRWLNRAKWVTTLPEAAIAGNGRLTVRGRVAPQQVVLEAAKFESTPLQLIIPGWQIDEPHLVVETAGTWTAKDQLWSAAETTLRGLFGEVRWTDGRYRLDAPALVAASGKVLVAIDLSKVTRWQQGDVRQHYVGQLQGETALTPDATGLQVQTDLTITKAVLVGISETPTPSWIALWREPEITLTGTTHISADSALIDLAGLRVGADGLALATKGRIEFESATSTKLDLTGQLQYDWDRVMPRVEPMLGKSIALQGKGERPFAVRGRLQSSGNGAVSLPDLVANAEVGWDRAQVYGVSLEANTLPVQFAAGQGDLGPVDLSLVQGRVHLAPHFDLRTTPTMSLPPGRILDRLQFTPELCAQWMKYVAPMVADAAEIQGQFSLELDENAWPVMTPMQGSARGRLMIDLAHVRPGALAGRIAMAVEQVQAIIERRPPQAKSLDSAWVQLPEQTVNFVQQPGRVSHDRLMMKIGNVDLATRGTVGFDESIQLVVELPIAENWVRKTPALAKLAGQPLQIPLHGTLKQPQVDSRFLSDFAQQAAGAAIGGEVEKRVDDVLQRGLDRFLPKR